MKTPLFRLAVFVLTCFATSVQAAGNVDGSIDCNDRRFTIRSAIALWQPKERTVSILLFDSKIGADVRDHWTKSGSPAIPQGMRYFAKFDVRIKKDASTLSRDALESYLLYVDCPSAQLNVNRSIFTDSQRMFRDFPRFEGSLQQGGEIRVTTREAETVKLMTTLTTWDLEIETTVSVK